MRVAWTKTAIWWILEISKREPNVSVAVTVKDLPTAGKGLGSCLSVLTLAVSLKPDRGNSPRAHVSRITHRTAHASSPLAFAHMHAH